MKRIMIGLLLAGSMSAGLAQAQEPSFREGVDYEVIEQASGYQPLDGVEVTEVFSYLCSHCNTFDPYMQAWKARIPEGVTLQRIPVEFGRAAWALYARAYVTASLMGVAEKAHVPMMDTLWKDKKQMRNMDELADFYATFGVDKEKFVSTSKSFAVDMRLRREQQLTRTWGVSATPTMIVNGKYRVTSHDFDSTLAVVDYLVAQELGARASTP
jgi:thiol:disulfide interchange protein DsbA